MQMRARVHARGTIQGDGNSLLYARAHSHSHDYNLQPRRALFPMRRVPCRVRVKRWTGNHVVTFVQRYVLLEIAMAKGSAQLASSKR